MFDAIDDSTFSEAERAIRSARTGDPYRNDRLPGLEHLIAATAVAIEKGNPRLVHETSYSQAGKYLEEGATEWRMMHRAVARAIDVDRAEPTTFGEPRDLMTHIASDVATQATFSRLDRAVRDPDLGAPGTEWMRRFADMARMDSDIARDVSIQAQGQYERLEQPAQVLLAKGLIGEKGSILSRQMREQIDEAAVRLARSGEDSMHRDAQVSYGAGHAAGAVFEDVRTESVQAANTLLDRGVSTGNPVVDRAILAHASVRDQAAGTDPTPSASDAPSRDPVSLIAYARAIQDMSPDRKSDSPVTGPWSSADLAGRIEADRTTMQDAKRIHPDTQGGRWRVLASGRYQDLDHDGQVDVWRNLETASGVPPVMLARLALAADSVERVPHATRGHVVQQAAAMQAMQAMR